MGCHFCKNNEDISRPKNLTSTPEIERKNFIDRRSENLSLLKKDVPHPLESKNTKKRVSFVEKGANIIDEQSGSKNLEPSGRDEDKKR